MYFVLPPLRGSLYFVLPPLRGSLSHNRSRMGPFSGGDPERQANIAFLLVFLGIVFVGGLTIWLFYGASF